jgi:hypothetical protein
VKKQRDSNDYWLAGPVEEAIGNLALYHDTYANFNSSTIQVAWLRNYFSYYSALTPPSWTSSFSFEGNQGEMIRLFTPKARTYINQLISVLTKKQLAFQAMAEASGNSIMQDVKLANAIAEQEIQLQNLNIKRKQALEISMVLGTAFYHVRWRTDKGAPHDVYKGNVVYTGGNQVDVKSVFDVFYDPSTTLDWKDIPWAETLTAMNRWDLIAQHPEMEQEILSLPSWTQIMGTNYYFNQRQDNRDMVGIYEAYGRPGPALGSKGRHIVYGSVDCVLYDGDNMYGTIPIEPLMLQRISQTGFGYPMLTDLIPANEYYDNTLSAICSNQSQHGVHDISIPRGAGIETEQMGGLRYTYFTPQSNVSGGGRPEALNLLNTSPEMFKTLDICDANMQTLSRLQPIMTGSTTGVTSGSMAATLIANALESVDSIGEISNIAIEKVMMHCINNVKMFGKLPMTVTINGTNGQLKSKKYTGEDLNSVAGMKLLVSNPMQHTVSGRVELANSILSINKEDRGAYISILNGGPLEDLTKEELSEHDLINLENEALMTGKPVIAMATDNHSQHILSHRSILNDPEKRMNSEVVQAATDHILEHLALSETTDPRLLALIQTGQLPPPMMAMPGAMPGQEAMPGMDGAMPGAVQGMDGSPQQELPGDVAVPAEPQQDILGRPTAGRPG